MAGMNLCDIFDEFNVMVLNHHQMHKIRSKEQNKEEKIALLA